MKLNNFQRALGYDGRMIEVGAVVRRRTCEPGREVWRVTAIYDDGTGRAGLSLVDTDDPTVVTSFYADFAVLDEEKV